MSVGAQRSWSAMVRTRGIAWFAIGGAFFVSLGLAVSIVVAFGTERGIAMALAATARLAFLVFWVAYAGGPLASLFGDAFSPLKERARDSGLAFAAAMTVHLGLVAWLCAIGPAPTTSTFVIFGVAAAFTYLLALLSNRRVRELLPNQSWPWLRALAMNYIALAFLYDFAKIPTIDLHNALKYLPFTALAIAAPMVRLAAWARTQWPEKQLSRFERR
ncbi:MAG: hypothetical protein ACLQUZ_02565 [Rhizomicrobium sp.]